MITAASLDDLPDNVPPLVREALGVSKRIDAMTFAKYGWERLPVPLILRFLKVDGVLQTSAGPLGLAGMTRPLAAELKDLINYKKPKPHVGQHVGTGALSEGILFVEEMSLPEVTGHKFEEVIDDLVAEGKVRQLRSTLVVLSSGWRYEYQRERAGNKITIDVYEPGDEWDCEEASLLALFDAKLLTLP